ncbi:MAG: hypothetical protein IKX34_05030 [Bacteroidales bacterium]|nr:hypothetical protein [Bacteroidales bacterium]
MHTLLLHPALLAILTLALVLVYMYVTLRLIRKNARRLWIPALLIAVLATVLYWYAYGVAGARNWLPRLVMSIVTGLDLFLFKAFCSLGVAPYFFATDPASPENVAVTSSHLILLYGLFLCAIWTTSILIVHLFARRFSSRLWLAFHHPSREKAHIFFGADKQALALAGDLAQKKDGRILFVVFPEGDALPAKISFLQFLRGGVSSGTGQYHKIRQAIPGAVILSARLPLKQCAGQNLFRELALTGLARWAQDPNTSLYILSDNYAENLFVLQSLPDCAARIFCRTERKGLNDSVELASNQHVRLIDRTYLTLKQMKTDPAFHPVRFVKRALDGQGQPQGWVEGGFHSLVLGFGETGRGALDFLYEFGAFVGEDKNQVPFLCEVLDRNAAALAGNYFLEHPGILPDRVRFQTMEIGTEAFWKHFEEALPTLNYVTVSLGDDALNVQLALAMLEMAYEKGNPIPPAIVVRLDNPQKYRRIIEFYAAGLQMDCVRILGGQEVWSVDSVVDETFEQHAKIFYEGYCQAAGEGAPWETMREAIEGTDKSALWKKREYRRKIGQNYSDYMHMPVKAALCPVSFQQDPAVMESIPSVYEGQHCTDPRFASVLEYLAIGEHLRWLASHAAAGYKWGRQKREDLKIHPAIEEYSTLTEVVRHYDWIVVKTTLRLLHAAAQSNSPA